MQLLPTNGNKPPNANAETMSKTFTIGSSQGTRPFPLILGHIQGNVKTCSRIYSSIYHGFSLEFLSLSCDNLSMDQTNEPQPPKSRRGLYFGLATLLAAMATIAVVNYSSQKGDVTPDDAGFDLSTTVAPLETAAPAAGPKAAEGSGLGMVDATGIEFGSGKTKAGQAEELKKAEQTLIDIARKNEKRVQALADAYAKKYPVVRQYAEEWMKYPDLKKLNDDYGREHDPVKFVRGLAKSPNFPKLMKKYASQAPLQQFVMEVYTKAPSDASQAASEIVAQDSKAVLKLVNSVTNALGLGPLLGSSLDDKMEKKGTLESATQTQSQLNQ